MNILVDTHVVLYLLDDEKRIPQNVLEKLKNPENEIFLSSVVLWEIVIKSSLKKLRIPSNYHEILAQQGYRELPITHAHVYELQHLPFHHKDPFDRMLIAQAIAENFTIITHDQNFRMYNVQLL